MFENWSTSEEYPTLFQVDRAVLVDTTHLFPGTGIRKDELPMWVKAFGLLLAPTMPARQIAWVRRADGGWIAVVVATFNSGNDRSAVTTNLWLPPEALLQVGGGDVRAAVAPSNVQRRR